MSATILTLLAAMLFGGLALLSQYARKNRAAEITLLITIVAASLLILLVGIFVGAGMFLLASREDSTAQQTLTAATGVAAVLGGLIGTGLCVPAIIRIFRSPKTRPMQATQNSDAAPWGTSSASEGVVDADETSRFWTDPTILFAVWLFALVLMNNLASILAFAISPEQTGELIAQAGQVTFGTVATSQLPFVIIAAAGVGLFVTRDWRETLARLGYGAINLKQLGMVGLFILGALVVSYGTDALFAALQPNLYDTVGKLSESMFSSRGMNPLSAVLFALMIGVGAGLGEESLFRGAVQPKLGIVLTSILFASMHIQYGPSILLLFIFLLSVALGFLRRYVNTTATFLAHAGYNASSVLLAYFVGI